MSNRNGSVSKLLHRTQWIFLVVSIIPMVVLAYLCVWHLFPALGEGQADLVASIYTILTLTILLSVLGYIISRKTALSTIEAISKNNRRLTNLLDLVNRLNLTTDQVKIEQEAVRSAARIIDADAVLLYLMNGEALICRHSGGVRLAKGEHVTCRPGRGSAGQAVLSKKVVQLDGPDVPAELPQALSALQGGPTLAIPQFFQDGLFGVLELLRRPGRAPFSTERRQMAEILGQSVASTIINARFHTSQKNFLAHIIELLRLAMESHIVWKDHLQNVTRYASLIGRRLDLSEEARREIHFAAILHDIGLLKLRLGGQLVDQEKCTDLFREHPVLGAELIEPIQVWKQVAPIIRHHHEYCDGSGYPEGLTGEQIPMGSRIIGVVEAYDTMINPDSYAETRSPTEALAELELHIGTRYDERVVGALREVLALEKK